MILDVESLRIAFPAPSGPNYAIVEDMSFSLDRGETLGLVGESGSGKSLLALAIIGLAPRPARVTGAIRFSGADLLTAGEARLCQVRGRRIGMIFQEPMTALNPAMRVGDQIAEGVALHFGLDRAAASAAAKRWLDRVHIPAAARRAGDYPHEFSGGQRQRVAIAIALALEPDLLIADEPTTALDVTVQAEILDLLEDLAVETGMAMLFVSHDFGVIARIAHRVMVMYAGARMELGPAGDVLRRPLHPYTRGLLAAAPRRGARAAGARLAIIPGQAPPIAGRGGACRFLERCPLAIPACAAGEPAWRDVEGRGVRCIRAGAMAEEPA